MIEKIQKQTEIVEVIIILVTYVYVFLYVFYEMSNIYIPLFRNRLSYSNVPKDPKNRPNIFALRSIV